MWHHKQGCSRDHLTRVQDKTESEGRRDRAKTETIFLNYYYLIGTENYFGALLSNPQTALL